MKSAYDRTLQKWTDYCDKHITAGPTAERTASYSFPEQGIKRAKQIRQLLNIQTNDFIVDIGCGNGRVPIGFAMDNLHVQYVGIDVIEGCIDFCKKAFADTIDFNFYHIDAYNPRYNPNGKILPEKVIYPIKSNSANFVLFNSVFTHIVEPKTITQMLNEAYRILYNYGICYCTWFLSPPNKLSVDSLRVVYLNETYQNLISNWYIIQELEGKTTDRHDQRLTILQKII